MFDIEKAQKESWHGFRSRSCRQSKSWNRLGFPQTQNLDVNVEDRGSNAFHPRVALTQQRLALCFYWAPKKWRLQIFSIGLLGPAISVASSPCFSLSCFQASSLRVWRQWTKDWSLSNEPLSLSFSLVLKQSYGNS